MEKVLEKLARQLNAYDEASLMAMWEKYAQQVQEFEPTKRWEEAALVFGMIQALRWKNQLFNYNWAQSARPSGERPKLSVPEPLVDSEMMERPRSPRNGEESTSGEGSGSRGSVADGDGASSESVKQRAKVLRFRPRESDDTV